MKKLSERELEQERTIEDEIERQQEAACAQAYSSNGLCPCCGVELEITEEEKWSGTFDNVLITIIDQFCPSCHWQSVPLYDA